MKFLIRIGKWLAFDFYIISNLLKLEPVLGCSGISIKRWQEKALTLAFQSFWASFVYLQMPQLYGTWNLFAKCNFTILNIVKGRFIFPCSYFSVSQLGFRAWGNRCMGGNNIFQMIYLIWSPLVRRHLFDHLLWSIFQSSLHILHITNHAGPSVCADTWWRFKPTI